MQRESVNSYNLLSLSEVCAELGISVATGRNWQKLGKLIPGRRNGNRLYFSRDYVEELKRDLTEGKNPSLRKRRNKKFTSGRGLYGSYVSGACRGISAVEQVMDQIQESGIQLDQELIRLLSAEAAVQMGAERWGYGKQKEETPPHLEDYLSGKLDFGIYGRLLDDLIGRDLEKAKKTCREYRFLFSAVYQWEENEDILGLLYISCQDLRKRRPVGSYYTPTDVVKKVIQNLKIETPGRKVLDPCCGTGNFLLQLPDMIGLENIFGNDTDAIGVKLTRINLALKFRPVDIRVLYRNITVSDYLLEYRQNGFDYILGNPPWGYDFSKEQKEKLRNVYKTADCGSPESYDVFLEHSLSLVKENGVVSFVLPEAILNVRSHYAIRSILAQETSFQFLEYLGNAFRKVQCPCIILQTAKTGKTASCTNMKVASRTGTYTIKRNRNRDPEYFNFAVNDEEYEILQRITSVPNPVYLAGHADFALGIVTGNNQKYISSVPTDENERVLRGANLRKYRFTDSGEYIVYKPEEFQQTAPTEYYRAKEKLLYRFICSQLVFAYDNQKTLSLNSCNILIPKAEGLSSKYIMAVLNSRIVQFFFKKTFCSVKVLRSHLEQIPIPQAEAALQKDIECLVDRILASDQNEEIQILYDMIDQMIRELYQIPGKEYQMIKEIVDAENIFLV